MDRAQRKDWKQASLNEVTNPTRKNTRATSRWEIDWGIDFSDTDLLDAMETTGDDKNINNKANIAKKETTR